MKNQIRVLVLLGIILNFLSLFSSNVANAEVPAYEIPDIESNLVVVAIGFRKTALLVNGLNVPIFTTETNNLERMDTGVLFCVVSPKQFAKTYFVLERENYERGGLTVMTPSCHFFEMRRFYQIPYSIEDLGFGQGTNIYFKGGGLLQLKPRTTTQNNTFAASDLQAAGDYCRTWVKRYYTSAEEARNELTNLRIKFDDYNKKYIENKEKIKNELEKRNKKGVVTHGIYFLDEKDTLANLTKIKIKIAPLYFKTKHDIENAEAQLRKFERQKQSNP